MSMPANEKKIGAVLLAAGGSKRMGEPKLLLPWCGKPIIRWVARLALEAGCAPLIVVTGAGAEEVQKALANLPVCFIHNPDWESGQSTSVKAGVAALSNDVAAAMVFLGDQPQIPLHVVEEIIETYRSSITAEPIFIPTVDGKRANPVLLDRSIFAQLVHLAGDTGARALFAQFPICYIPFSEPDLLLDIDNPDDYQRLIEKQPPF